jgi:hypothetical protein
MSDEIKYNPQRVQVLLERQRKRRLAEKAAKDFPCPYCTDVPTGLPENACEKIAWEQEGNRANGNQTR